MIDLQTLKIRNFKSFGNTTQSVDLAHLGLTLLVGKNKDEFQSNGAGKSSFLEAIIYALYGSTSNGDKGDSLVNRKVGKDMSISLSFTDGKDKYVIKRYRKDSTYKNKSFLYLNGKNITQRSIKATNKLLVNILGVDEKTYLHSYAFGLNSGASFASMTDRQKKQVLDNMADLLIYPIARKVSKQDGDKTQSDIDVLKKKIDVTKYNLKSLKSIQDSSASEAKDEHEKLLHVKNRLATLKHKCLSLGTTQNTHSYSYLQKQIKHLKSVNRSYLPKIKQYQSVQKHLSLAESALNTLRDHVKQYSMSMAKIKKTEKKRLTQIQQIKNGKQKTCYWCGQPVGQKEKQHLLVKLAKDYVAQQKSYKATNSTYESLLTKCTVVQHSITKTKDNTMDIATIEKNISSNRNKINAYNQQIIQIKQDLHDLKVASQQYQDLNKQHTLTDHTDKIRDIMNKLASQSKSLKLLQTKLKLYRKSEDVYSNHGVKSMVLDLILPFINKQANHYLKLLTSGDISLAILPTTTSKSTGKTSQKINLQITNLHGADSYDGLSSGEKKRVDLSILLSLQDYVLSKVSSRMNLIYFDELFSHLDESSYEGVMKVLFDRLKEIPNIIVVTHQPKLMEKFENKLVVTKHNGVSTISK